MTLIENIIEGMAYEGAVVVVTLSGVNYRLEWIDNKYMVVRK
jgi:hypothetical protein